MLPGNKDIYLSISFLSPGVLDLDGFILLSLTWSLNMNGFIPFLSPGDPDLDGFILLSLTWSLNMNGFIPFLSPGDLDLDGFILLSLTWSSGPGWLHTPSSRRR